MATERTEDYLKMLDSIIKKKGYARVKDVSEIMGLNPSSVTGMFKKLNREGYINYEKYGAVTLTPNGEEIARATEEKYDVLQEFLQILGVEAKTADEDACRIEHGLTHETLDVFTKFVEFINKKEELPLWLEHFRYFYNTGEYVECTPATQDGCPVHGKKKTSE
ncbi:metal-dependent transcriptional regulator [Methanococcoides seepicolus]|uniref:Metal-dependent transcriptional regulator n=1 Tax=Methanococcoides seepicolus TaxID=2828780 RepID=A0A9E4ZFW7_9EURY|nr:metal-dependent transcriptional regulator [Methanococcoides seepicolus]MCM1986932.1 metal-dependent transcriptional regulator [Methanococcoides seepicolus]